MTSNSTQYNRLKITIQFEHNEPILDELVTHNRESL